MKDAGGVEIRPIDVLTAAADLLSESGENPEYDRAIVELTCDVVGIGTKNRHSMMVMLRALKGS